MLLDGILLSRLARHVAPANEWAGSADHAYAAIFSFGVELRATFCHLVNCGTIRFSRYAFYASRAYSVLENMRGRRVAPKPSAHHHNGAATSETRPRVSRVQ